MRIDWAQRKSLWFKSFGGVILCVIVYFIIIPSWWDPPLYEFRLPDTWPHNEDMPIDLVVSAEHRNFQVKSVMFLGDNELSSLDDSRVRLYSERLLDDPETLSWTQGSLNRFTYPYSRIYTLTLPLADMAAKREVSSGQLEAKFEVVMRFAYLRSRTVKGSRGTRNVETRGKTRSTVDYIPVSITLE
jgi:hypothetical protein